MHWESAAEFFAMGGYGVYVWGAYGITALALAIEVWQAQRRLRKARAALIRRDAPVRDARS